MVYSGLFEGAAAEFMDWIWPIHARMLLHVHRVANIYIARNRDGDLVSESYVQVLLRTRESGDGSMTDTIGDGRYVDRWAQKGGRLAITERDYVRDAVRTHRHPPNDVPTVRPALGGVTLTSARDASDASHRLLRA